MNFRFQLNYFVDDESFNFYQGFCQRVFSEIKTQQLFFKSEQVMFGQLFNLRQTVLKLKRGIGFVFKQGYLGTVFLFLSLFLNSSNGHVFALSPWIAARITRRRCS